MTYQTTARMIPSPKAMLSRLDGFVNSYFRQSVDFSTHLLQITGPVARFLRKTVFSDEFDPFGVLSALGDSIDDD